jgi:tetratricopeptide (TPR) repeat protein
MSLATSSQPRFRAFTALDRHEEAIKQYEKAIAIDPELADAYYNLNLALQAVARDKEADQKLQRAIKLEK